MKYLPIWPKILIFTCYENQHFDYNFQHALFLKLNLLSSADCLSFYIIQDALGTRLGTLVILKS